ncbi:hypothetical protein H113_09007 [Trichophyton rubrum MR1459]|uniref:Cytochrome P450 n=1 Tax=Trichophyton rubrum (strain ATCC MYA-4607 / CBS 118892) TaxID=559305 RepID=F2SCQ4_TRIRC|nr:uncharacterized protein TERG_01485 [Trichophyton rubrum CBS 118892]EGD85209.2 hypothetical protein TERG_01485 [Trichophyton rubrum CBS 118892]EZF89745.1 hypothetical protein H113_09007 [Trichophyton rubrum MR1459]
MKVWARDIPNEGIIRYYIAGNLEGITVTSPKLLSEILVSKTYNFAKPLVIQQGLGRLLGNGILLAENDEHKVEDDRLLSPVLFLTQESYASLCIPSYKESLSCVLVQEYRNGEIDSKGTKRSKTYRRHTIEVRNWAGRSSLDIIGLVGIGRDFDSLRKPENDLSRSYGMIFTAPDVMTKALFMLGMLLGDTKWLAKLPTRRNKTIDTGRNNIRNAARQMIEERKAKMKDPNGEIGVDIISVAMQSGNFDNENLVDQLMTFLGAGHETTAAARQWAIYSLCKHPEVQTRLREEVRAYLPPINVGNPGTIDAAAVGNLQYLNVVCNEVIRFRPSIPNTVRVALKDTTLMGKPIPKNTQIVISPELINHMPEFWGQMRANSTQIDSWALERLKRAVQPATMLS